MRYSGSKSAFSTLMAILMTAFLIAISAGVLSLFVWEGRINRTLFDGISAYSTAEGGIEYALLKIKNHEAGFQDSLVLSDDEAKVFVNDSKNRRPSMIGYDISASGKSYSGNLIPGGFDIIPLSVDQGQSILSSDHLKSAEKSSIPVSVTTDFVVTPQNEMVWNVLATSSQNITDGVVGTGGINIPFGAPFSEDSTIRTNGIMKKMETNTYGEEVNFNSSATIASMLADDYKNPYLILYNPSSDTGATYNISSEYSNFAFPVTSIVGHGKIGSTTVHLQLSDVKSKYSDALKYSLYNNTISTE